MQPDDAYWRRPEEGSPPEDWAQRPSPATPGHPGDSQAQPGPHSGRQPTLPNLIYHGPPVSMAPPTGWRPPHIVEPAPPRQLPEQDHVGIDEQEARARTLSLGLAIVAAAVMVIVFIAVCGRTLF